MSPAVPRRSNAEGFCGCKNSFQIFDPSSSLEETRISLTRMVAIKATISEKRLNTCFDRYINRPTGTHSAKRAKSTGEIETKSTSINLESITNVRQFCEKNDIEISVLFQVAWAMVLRSYCTSNIVEFGYVDLDDISKASLCRIDFAANSSLRDMFHNKQYAKDAKHSGQQAQNIPTLVVRRSYLEPVPGNILKQLQHFQYPHRSTVRIFSFPRL